MQLHQVYSLQVGEGGGGEILSSSGTTQGDPPARGAYALGILP